MQIVLNRSVMKALHVGIKPPDGQGDCTLADFVPNPTRKPYYLWDSSPGSPPGFGVYVGKRGVSVVLSVRDQAGRRQFLRVGAYGRPGRAADLDAARASAAAMREELRDGVDIRSERRARHESLKRTVREVMEDYITDGYEADYRARHGREPRANTVRQMRASIRRMGGFADRVLYDLTEADCVDMFESILGRGHRTSAEIAARWGHAAFEFALEQDRRTAAVHRRDPVLRLNPFAAAKKRIRSRAVLERDAHISAVRNPLQAGSGILGLWLDALVEKRNAPGRGQNRQAADYLLLTLLCGTRRNELAILQWEDRIKPEERGEANTVRVADWCLELHVVKGRQALVFPLASLGRRILEERLAERGDSPYVFPAPKAHRARRVEHYSDPREAMKSVTAKVAAGIRGTALADTVTWVPVLRPPASLASKGGGSSADQPKTIKLTMHDLRRTFATLAATLEVPPLVLKLLLNHSVGADVTALYVQLGVDHIRKYAQRIEDAMLKGAPSLLAWYLEGK